METSEIVGMVEKSQWIETVKCGEISEREATAITMPDQRTVALFFWNGEILRYRQSMSPYGFPSC